MLRVGVLASGALLVLGCPSSGGDGSESDGSSDGGSSGAGTGTGSAPTTTRTSTDDETGPDSAGPGTQGETTSADPSSGGDETASPTTSGEDSTGEAPGDEWLVVDGNRIRHGDGTPFHGRGANLHDERSCSACSFMPANPTGLDRWADELIDNWHANFIRFDLSAKPAPYNEYELQWESLVDDDAYFADVVHNVEHMTGKPGVYVMVTLFADPSIKENNGEYDSEWPSSLGDTNTRYTRLAEAFHDNPRVLFGLTNEPHTQPEHDAELAQVYLDAIAAIRAVEDSHGAPHHIVVVQAPEGWARDLTYFVANPLPGDQIAYEVHPYNPASDFDALLVQPSQTLPILIGEYGPADGFMTFDDILQLWTVAQANEIPHIAWAFHHRCPPNLLQDTASDGCGLDASTGYMFPRTDWGDLLHDHLATPW